MSDNADLTRQTVNKYERDRSDMIRGTAGILADPAITTGDIYEFDGLGAFFSGNYYVVKSTHTFNRNGYSQSLEVIKQSWDGTAVVDTTDMTLSTLRPVKAPVAPVTTPSKYTVVPGDTLWGIAGKSNIYGDSSQWTKLWDKNKAALIARDPRNATDYGHWIYPQQVLDY